MDGGNGPALFRKAAGIPPLRALLPMRALRPLCALGTACLQHPAGPRRWKARFLQVAAAILLASNFATHADAQRVELPHADAATPIVIWAPSANRWMQGSYEIWILDGGVEVVQGPMMGHARSAVLWVERSGQFGDRHNTVQAYLDGDVVVQFGAQSSQQRVEARNWYGRFYSRVPIQLRTPPPGPEPLVKPAVFDRALQHRSAHLAPQPASRPPAVAPVRRVQFELPTPTSPNEPPPLGNRRLRIFSRTSAPVQATYFPVPERNEWIALVDSGVNLIIDGIEGAGVIDILTDRMVIWTAGTNQPDLSGQSLQQNDTPLEIYMEGDIEFRQGDRVIYADRMYYDVTRKIGTVLQAEMLTPVPEYAGLLRLKAELVRQIGPDRFFAENAFITSSRMGKPGYRIQSGNVELLDEQQPAFDPLTGGPIIDPQTGLQQILHRRRVTSRDNFVYLGPVPIFYWPVLATDADDPSFYLHRVRFKNDSIFGTQILSDWNLYELLGIENAPEGTEWDGSLDYLSDRGVGFGTTFTYALPEFLGNSGPTWGLFDIWAIDDSGVDNLGIGRPALVPEKQFRHRLLWKHRQMLPYDLRLTGEAGWISDRNFLEQYYEHEWDENKDQTTGLELKRLQDDTSWSITADARLNDFFTQTEWLPRVDHYVLGRSLLSDRLTWFAHSSAGYANLRTARPPEDPLDAATFAPLPWEVTSSGERFATRHEIDLPLRVGPAKIVPYALGEYAHWGEDLTGSRLDRLYGQAGVRARLPISAVNPTVESSLLNVHGLAHKLTLGGEVAYADANQNLAGLPLYDPLDDDATEHFRRRFAFTTFGGATPLTFDERFYALRSGIASWVTSPTTEVADDLAVVRMGVYQRFQTKRGAPGQRRTIDWIVLDTQATWFPDADRDNFGEELGLVDYDFRWHVGDRLTLLSQGAFDFFDAGQQLLRVTAHLNRPPRGDLYISFRVLEGPFTSQVASVSYRYRMSPKWASTFGTSVDVGGAGNIGQFLELVRIGESFLVSVGFNVDAGKDTVGLSFAIEPRFLASDRFGWIGGGNVPVAGQFGLE